MLECSLIGRIQDLLAWDALLALALLEEKMLTTVALVGELAASCALQTLFGAAMSLELWHVARKGNEKRPKSKGLPLGSKDDHEVISLAFHG